jgi:uncharacterized membrane protein YfcA
VDPIFPATGFVVGILVGLTGMGGAALMTPFLIPVLGTTPVVAVGTDLVYGAVTKIVGGFLHWRHGTVDMAIVRRLALGSVPAGVLAAMAVHLLPDSVVDSNLIVRRALGAALILVSLILLSRKLGVRPPPLPERWHQWMQGRGTVAVGAVVGALVGFTSVGSGSLLVPFLIGAFMLTPAQVVGTDVVHAAILVTATGAAHAQAGAVDWAIVAGLLVGSVPGVALGSWLAPRLPAPALRLVLAVLLLATGIVLVTG